MQVTQFKDTHRGERCFVIGTGPSINKTNLNLLKGEWIFGVNTLYDSNFDLTYDYYAVSDLAVWQAYYDDLLKLDTVLFLSGFAAVAYMQRKPNLYNKEPVIIPEVGRDGFSLDISKGLFNNETVVTDICTQVAYYMGFEKVYVLGIDCDYSGWHRFNRPKSENITTPAIEGDFTRIFNGFRVAKRVYENDGRELINCTVGGKLEVLKRQTLEDVLNVTYSENGKE